MFSLTMMRTFGGPGGGVDDGTWPRAAGNVARQKRAERQKEAMGSWEEMVFIMSKGDNLRKNTGDFEKTQVRFHFCEPMSYLPIGRCSLYA